MSDYAIISFEIYKKIYSDNEDLKREGIEIAVAIMRSVDWYCSVNRGKLLLVPLCDLPNNIRNGSLHHTISEMYENKSQNILNDYGVYITNIIYILNAIEYNFYEPKVFQSFMKPVTRERNMSRVAGLGWNVKKS